MNKNEFNRSKALPARDWHLQYHLYFVSKGDPSQHAIALFYLYTLPHSDRSYQPSRSLQHSLNHAFLSHSLVTHSPSWMNHARTHLFTTLRSSAKQMNQTYRRDHTQSVSWKPQGHEMTKEVFISLVTLLEFGQEQAAFVFEVSLCFVLIGI